MAKDSVSSTQATLYDLQQPEKLSKVIAAQGGYEDCLSCRLTGAAAFGGLGAYTYFSGQKQLQSQRQKILKSGSRFGMKSRKAGITGISLTLLGMGFWRLIN